jgi:hypothetical protein
LTSSLHTPDKPRHAMHGAWETHLVSFEGMQQLAF